MKKIPAAVFLLAILTAATAAAAPLDVIRDKYDGIKTLVSKNLDRKSFDDAVRKELDTFVDYEELSKRTLGDNWNKLKPKDRQRFVAGFKQMIQRSGLRKHGWGFNLALSQPLLESHGLHIIRVQPDTPAR